VLRSIGTLDEASSRTTTVNATKNDLCAQIVNNQTWQFFIQNTDEDIQSCNSKRLGWQHAMLVQTKHMKLGFKNKSSDQQEDSYDVTISKIGNCELDPFYW
jgi:hypothetical protein